MTDYAATLIPCSEVQIPANTPLLSAIKIIEHSLAKIALVADAGGHIIGSLTDGDVRRALLNGSTLHSPVIESMHKNPHLMPATSTRRQLLEYMLALQIKQIPLVHNDGRLHGVAVYDLLSGFEKPARTTPVIIMAGGKGKRLWPLTNDMPKPMILLGNKPMLEHIIQHFLKQGFSDFHLAINYLGEQIQDFAGDGSQWGCRITYLHEQDFLGTAGALSLLTELFSEPFIVINGDILTSVDFSDVLEFHLESNAIATVCARSHRLEVPYGVIQLDNGLLKTIVEKPVYEDLVSAGIYIFNPQVLPYVPANSVLDMPDLLLSLVSANERVAVFPMREDWIDIGRHDDLDKAKLHFLANKP